MVVALGFLYSECNAETGDFTVKASRGRLSVKADEAQFGHIMEEIARKAGFEVTISTDVAIRTISTDFRDLELEQGINRLMGLIKGEWWTKTTAKTRKNGRLPVEGFMGEYRASATVNGRKVSTTFTLDADAKAPIEVKLA